MGMKNAAGNCLIRIDTDSGLTGYGQAGVPNELADIPLLVKPFTEADLVKALATALHPGAKRSR